QRFRHRRVADRAALELEPRNAPGAILGELRVRPADAEQRLVRERPFETHALERRLRERGFARLQPRVAERDVRLVPERRDRLARLGTERTAADPLEHRGAFTDPPLADA